MISWTIVPKNAFPKGRHCASCEHKVETGDIVLTFPCLAGGTKELLGTVVVHRTCLAKMIEIVPEPIDFVRDKVEKIKAKFVKREIPITDERVAEVLGGQGYKKDAARELIEMSKRD